VYDDHLAIEENPHLKLWPGWSRIFFSDIWTLSSLGRHSNYYRPLFLLSYAGIFQTVGASPWFFHLVNLLFHAATTAMVFLLTHRIWKKDSIAAISTVLFALHPTHIEPVAWVAALSELGYTFFVLLALYLYVQEQPSRWSSAAALSSYAIALLWKESALAFIPLAILFDVLVRKSWQWKRWIAAVAVTLGYMTLRFFALGGLAPSVVHPNLSLWTQILTAISNVAFYLRKLIAPINLSIFYDPQFVSVINVEVAVVLLLAALVLWRFRGKTAWSALWIVAGLLPVLVVSRVAAPLSDRSLYLPSLGFIWLIAVFLHPFGGRIVVPAVTILSIAYGAVVFQRLPAWRDDLPIFQQALRQQPDSTSLRLLLASELARRGHHDFALRYLDEILSRNPTDLEALTSKGGVQVAMQDFSGARSTCERALALDPNAARCLYNIGYLDEVGGRFVEARANFERAYKINPELSQALLHQGLMEARVGMLDAAAGTLERAVQRIPTAAALNNLGSVYAERGEFAKAIRTFQTALRVDPSFELAQRNLEQAIADSR
jgi:tetratricopeptide (TPR) repeat protein